MSTPKGHKRGTTTDPIVLNLKKDIVPGKLVLSDTRSMTRLGKSL